jgi:eukaryotic-like serine/threonine-protein kinase
MTITDPLLLPPDVLLVPVAELPEEVRRQLTYDEGDYAVTRPRARTPSRIVDAQAVELLREFGSPRTIVEAVLRFARAQGASPEATLDDAYPLLERLIAAGFLVAEGADDASGIRPSLAPGEHAGCWEVVEAVQVLDDTELYQATDGERYAALKIERPGGPRPAAVAAFAREAAVLAALAAAPDSSAFPFAPRLLEAGEHAGRSFLAIGWCAGVDAETAAREAAHDGESPATRATLLALCRGIAGAYVRLHERGFVHGDVHPRNVLVGADGAVRLIDFGLSVPGPGAAAGSSHGIAGAHRGGVGFFFEPEYAAACAGEGPGVTAVPPASPAGEQYAVGALLYYLVTGAHYRDFSLEREAMFRQIAAEPPLPFVERGVAPWPELETVLARALAKDPAARFPSLAALESALAEVPVMVPPTEASRRAAPSPLSPSPARSLLAEVLTEVAVCGPLTVATRPTASLFFGAAGIAYGLYRMALQRDDAALLSTADLWLLRAERAAGAEDAFLDPALELTAATVGEVSPWHSPSGLAVVRALLAHAQGDVAGARSAAAAFLHLGLAPVAGDAPLEGGPAAPVPALPDGISDRDLTLGRSSLILAAANLAPLLPADAPERARLAELSGRIVAGLWEELDALPPLTAQPVPPNLGIAHGWAGYAYAALRWCRAFGTAPPAGLRRRIDELAVVAEPWRRGLRWRWNDGKGGLSAPTMPGWCNGSAGFVYLWTLAHHTWGEPRFLDLATGAAWNAWEAGESGGSLCCGAAGRAYALLELARHLGGEPRWIERARTLADRAALAIAAGSEKADSLYKGRIGVALLAADLERPENAVLPFFADEGWSAD